MFGHHMQELFLKIPVMNLAVYEDLYCEYVIIDPVKFLGFIKGISMQFIIILVSVNFLKLIGILDFISILDGPGIIVFNISDRISIVFNIIRCHLSLKQSNNIANTE